MQQIAALFVRSDSIYWDRNSIEAYDVTRNALTYTGNSPILAHPPCARWGRFWWADGSITPGMDNGLFEFSLAQLRRVGGVIEHPAASHAFKMHDLGNPQRGFWKRNLWGDWVTEVDQSQYGHRAQKSTWLVARSDFLPDLRWEEKKTDVYLSQPGRCSRLKPRKTCCCRRCSELFGTPQKTFERMSKKEQELTPEPFADLLIQIAESGTPSF